MDNGSTTATKPGTPIGKADVKAHDLSENSSGSKMTTVTAESTVENPTNGYLDCKVVLNKESITGREETLPAESTGNDKSNHIELNNCNRVVAESQETIAATRLTPVPEKTNLSIDSETTTTTNPTNMDNETTTAATDSISEAAQNDQSKIESSSCNGIDAGHQEIAAANTETDVERNDNDTSSETTTSNKNDNANLTESTTKTTATQEATDKTASTNNSSKIEAEISNGHDKEKTSTTESEKKKINTNNEPVRKKYSMRTERVELYPKYKLEDIEVLPPKPKRVKLKDKPPIEVDLTDEIETQPYISYAKPTVIPRQPSIAFPATRKLTSKISPQVVLKNNISGLKKKAKMRHTSIYHNNSTIQNNRINLVQNHNGVEKAKTKFSSRISPRIGTVSMPSINGELIAHKTLTRNNKSTRNNKPKTNGKTTPQRNNSKNGKKYYFRTGERVPEYERLVEMGNDPPCFMKAYINDDIRYGVFPTRKFEKNEILLEYKGTLVTMEEAQELHKHYASTGQGCYIVDFLHNGQHMCVDATEADCYGRYVNDAVQRYANCEIKKYVVNDVPHLFLVAKREIPKLEELRYDYGDTKNITWRHIAKNKKPFNLNTLWSNNADDEDEDDDESEDEEEDNEENENGSEE